MKDLLKVHGHAIFELRDKVTGKVKERWEADNTVSSDGHNEVAKLICGVDTVYFRAIAVGVGTPGASALGSENQRALATIAYVASAQAQFTYTFSFGSSFAITEAGVFNNSVSGGIMLDSFSFSAKNVDASTQLYVQITVTT
jgi:hypothetical protein